MEKEKAVMTKDNEIYSFLIPIRIGETGEIVYKSRYSWKTEKEFLEEGYEIVSWTEWIKRSINQDYKNYKVGKWEKTTEQKFIEMLEVLRQPSKKAHSFRDGMNWRWSLDH